MIAFFALGVLAVTAIVAVAARSGRAREADSQEALFADRRRELNREAEAQNLGAAELAALEEELALNHLDESARLEEAGEVAPSGRVPLLPFLAGSVAMLLVAITLYAVWGEPEAPVLSRASEIMRDADRPEMRVLEAALEARLARERDDLNAWFLLGHLRMQLEDHEGASQTFAELHDIAGPIADVDVAWAQARYRMDGGEMSAATREIVDRVLAERPDHASMLELLAVDAIHRRDFAQALEHLSRVLRQSMPESRRRELAGIMALARSRLPDDAAGTKAEPPASGKRAGITMSVSLAVPLDADPGTPVFVIARDPDAPRPPLAVRRLTVGDLPARIELGDADAMMPGRSLSDLDSVEVLARVSLSGSPSARTGDVESEVATATPGGDPIELRVEHRVP